MRQARKSLAHVPSTDVSDDKENLTVDSAALSSLTVQGKQATKKSRSKSLGHGGLGALKETTGNKQEVGDPKSQKDVRRSIDIACPTTVIQVYLEADNTVVASEDYPATQWRRQSFSWQI